MSSFRELLAAAKSKIQEVDTQTVAEKIAAKQVVVLDVREPDEFEQGALKNVVHIPRGHLEAQVESKIVDKNSPVIVYCAGGVRSAFAESTLRSPTRSRLCKIWRCKLDASTTSISTMPIVPTPAAAKYIAAGEPSPPAPSNNTLLESNFD